MKEMSDAWAECPQCDSSTSLWPHQEHRVAELVLLAAFRQLPRDRFLGIHVFQ